MASDVSSAPRGEGAKPADISVGDEASVVRTVKGVRPARDISNKSDTVSRRVFNNSTTIGRASGKMVAKVVREGFSTRRIDDPRSLTAEALLAIASKKSGDPFVLSVYKTKTGEEYLSTKSMKPTTIASKVVSKITGAAVPDSDKPETVVAFVVKAFNRFSNDPHSTLEDAEALITFYDFITKWSEKGSKLDPKMKEQLSGLKEELKKVKSATLPDIIDTARAYIKYSGMDVESFNDLNSSLQPEQTGFLKALFDKLGPEGTLDLVIEQTKTYNIGEKTTAFRGNDTYIRLIKMFLSLQLQSDFQQSTEFKNLLSKAGQTQQSISKLLDQAWDGVVRDLQALCAKKPDVQKFLKELYNKCEQAGIEPGQMVGNIVCLRVINPLIINESLKKDDAEGAKLRELSAALQKAVNVTGGKAQALGRKLAGM